MLPRLLALLSLVLPGCYLHHGGEPRPEPPVVDADLGDAGGPPRDGGEPRSDAGRDAGPPDRPDAGLRDGVHWTLVQREAWLRIPHELGCTAHDGGRVVVEVSIPFVDVCDRGGPVEVERADDGTFLVRAYVWRQQHLDPDECPGVTAIATRSLVLEASAGTFRAETIEGGSSVSVDVSPPAPADPPCSRAGGPDAPCIRDCECSGELVCVPVAGDFVMCDGGRCGAPCDVQTDLHPPLYGAHLDCPRMEECGARGGVAAPTCGRIERGGCNDDPMGCGPGTICPATSVVSECAWAIELNGAVRHPCGSDADCSEGLYCVQHADGARACEVPCLTPAMRCPPMHACHGPRWVCEWLGE